jgi:hypothetical protein
LSVSASATFERETVALLYLDIVLVLIVAAPAIASGAPAVGYSIGGAAWILMRGLSVLAERRIAAMPGDVRRRLALGVAFSMLRVWVLAIAIIVAGVAAARADGLTAALVIFGAFSVRFACSAFAHVTEKRSTI